METRLGPDGMRLYQKRPRQALKAYKKHACLESKERNGFEDKDYACLCVFQCSIKYCTKHIHWAGEETFDALWRAVLWSKDG